MLQDRREKAGWSIRAAAAKAGMSDPYWGQMEKGYVKNGDDYRPVKPSVGSLLQAAGALRLTDEETNHLLDLADYPRMPRRRSTPAPAGYDVDTTNLSKDEVNELNRLADVFRRSRQQS
jgi:transcriptional regulator with XRE-family HTH domain